MTERQLQDAVTELAQLLGWWAYHTHDSRHSAAGFPDLVLVRDRRIFYAELKSETGVTTESQRAWAHALLEAGQTVHLWRPADWTSGAVEEVLRAY